MSRQFRFAAAFLFLATSLLAQNRRLWVLRSSGDVVEYDPSTFAVKQTVKVPTEATASPAQLSVNSLGQMLFASTLALPLSEDDPSAERQIWIFDGHQARTLTRDVSRTTVAVGSNLSITESAPMPYLSADGTHLYWFSNQARRLQRDGVDLSIKTTWSAWRTSLDGLKREEVASKTLPDCPCPSGGCEETCPYGQVWVPAGGVDKFFVMTQFVPGQTKSVYQSSTVYEEGADKWMATPVDSPLRIVLDAPNPGAILEAIPDTGCCGWSNESDDQTLLRLQGKVLNVFDELATYKNPDYDVTFYTQNGKLSPDLKLVAVTITATSKSNTPIQLAEQGQANPLESQSIRKALAELPAVEIKAAEGAARSLGHLPHAVMVGWISDAEILIVEDNLLVAYNVATKARRKSSVKADDAASVFLR